MFLAWNYTLELFFWIIVGAVVLVSLTILLAGPKFRAKVAKLSEDPLSLTGKNIDSYNQKKVSKKINSSKIEEDVDFIEEKVESEVLKGRLPFFTKVYGVIFLYALYSSLVILYGILIIYSEICHEIGLFASDKTCNQEGAGRFSSNFEVFSSFGYILLGSTFSLTGLSSLYGFLVENKRWLKYSCRITTVAFLLSIIFITGGGPMTFAFMIIPLIVSGDLKLLWLKINNYDKKKEKEVLDKNVGFYTKNLYVLYSIFLIFSAIFFSLKYNEMLMTYYFGIPLFLCGLFNLYYFLINDEKNMKFWNRITFAAVFGGSLFISLLIISLTNITHLMNIISLGNVGFFLSSLIPLYFSGDLKIVLSKIYRSNNYDVSLWWAGVPAGVLCLLLVIAIFGPFGFLLFAATVILVTIYININ